MMTIAKLAAAGAVLYLAVVLLMALLQDRLIFPRWAAAGVVELPASAERLEVATPSGERLAGVRLPPPGPPPPGAALVLGFGGNAWNGDVLAGYLHSLFPDREIVAFHYRGYGPSGGRPSARALLEDALLVHDHVRTTLRPRRIVAVGFSIGAGPAAHLASRRPVAGAILVTPFDTLEALAREHYGWAPVGLLLRHRMDVAGALSGSPVPVALIAAERDSIVPPRRTAALRAATERLVLDRVIADVGHNDLYDSPAFVQAAREALALIEAEGADR